MTQVFRSLIPIWEIWVEFLVPGRNVALLMAVVGLWGVKQQMEDLCLFFLACAVFR